MLWAAGERSPFAGPLQYGAVSVLSTALSRVVAESGCEGQV